MTKYNVLHIITRLDKGGSAENTLATVVGMDKTRFHSVLVSGPTRDPSGAIEAAIQKQGLEYILIPELVRQVNLFKDTVAFFKLCRIIRQGKFDIVHTHTSKAGMLGRWAAKCAGVRIIVHTPHGHVFYGYFGKFSSFLFVLLERLTARITDVIIALTEKGIEEHLKFKIAKKEKFTAIYSGIDVGTIHASRLDKTTAKTRLGLKADALVIGTVTRLEPVKGNRYLIEAIPALIRSFPEIQIVFAGDGSQRGIFKKYLAERGIQGHVVFLGIRQDIEAVLSAYDLFVLPSLMEGMGKSLLQSQGLGVPVVATNVGGIPEVVKDGQTGVLIPPADSKAIVEAVVSLLHDPERMKRFSAEGRNWVDEKFSIETMVKKTEALYEQLIVKPLKN